jgi:type IV pilus assembly protein PilC
MLFIYKAVENSGLEREGTIDALNSEIAITSLQRRGLVVTSISEADKKSLLDTNISLFQGISNRDIVVLSRQISTLFEAQVSALRVFRLLSGEVENKQLGKILAEVSDDIQGGSSMSKAMEKHKTAFSAFYVSMVRAGEESGKLTQSFLYLADYLDRNYEVSSKAKNALIYPAFIISTFIIVMILMLTMVIPRISAILTESGQAIPFYTQVVVGFSNFLVNYGVFLVPLIILVGYFLFRFSKTDQGQISFSSLKLQIPYVGDLYKKLYLSRMADNFSTMLDSGIPIVRVMEVTADVVDNRIYQDILREAADKVTAGSTLSQALGNRPEIPGIMIAMIKVGEESGEMGAILKTLAKFYSREVVNAVDTLVDLIEPVMIVLLGLGVGMLLASVLIPIYNLSSSF